MLYEDFVKTSASPLPCQAAVLIGGDDKVTDRANVLGWADEVSLSLGLGLSLGLSLIRTLSFRLTTPLL